MPVFLIYAGVIHAIGLALLLPMIITLPGPSSQTAPEAAAIDVEIILATPLAGTIEPEGDQTSALPSASPDGEGEGGVEQDQGAGAVAPASPEAPPDEEETIAGRMPAPTTAREAAREAARPRSAAREL